MFRISIQKKITLALSVLIFITVLSLGLVMDKQAEELVYAEVLRSNDQALSNVSAYYLRPYITRIETVISDWATDPIIVDADGMQAVNGAQAVLPEELQSVTDAWSGLLSGNQELKSIYFGSAATGRLMSSPEDLDLPKHYDARMRGWYQGACANPGHPYWSTAYADAGKTGEAVITVSQAVVSDGRIAGVVAIDMEIAQLSRQIGDIDIGEGGYLMILNADGIVYAHPDYRKLNKQVDPFPWIGQVLAGQAGSDFARPTQSPYTYSYLTIPETGWKLVSVRPVTIQGLLSDIQGWTIGTALIAALIAILIAQIFARYMLRPVASMMQVISGISSGQMDSRMDIHSHDEFQVLGTQFNAMLDRIARLIRERDGHLDHLLQRNSEILLQKEEIQALHEETEAMNENLSDLLTEIEGNYAVTVRALANAIEASDSYTRGHCDRVGYYALKLADALGLTEYEQKHLRFASMLHDVGKIGIPGSILNKTTALTDDEFEIIRSHPQIGYDILNDISFLEECRNILLQHHERVDGKGYPHRLTGDAIHPAAKILAIADSYDAMTSARAYRNTPLSEEAALQQLENGRGTQYDSEMADAFIQLCKQESESSYDEQAQ